jgi:RimJ/RimL family protein N-acetyltransferase
VEPTLHLTAARLESERLTLEPLRVEHAEELAPLLNDTSLHRFTGGTPDTPAELRARFERQTRGHSPDGQACWLNWVLRHRATDEPIGTVQATVTIEDRAVVAELAWVVGHSYQGRGFAKEGATAVAAWLREQGATHLRAHVHPHHYASMAIARAIGLQPTDTIVDGEVSWEAAAGAGAPFSRS